MVDTVSVNVILPLNATPLERAQAIIAAMSANGGIGAIALGQLLGDLRPYLEPAAACWPRQELRFYSQD